MSAVDSGIMEEHSRVLESEKIHLLYHFIECRNIILNTKKSLELMTEMSYCRSRISVLVLDNTRPNVARLVAIKSSRIEALAKAFEFCLETIFWGTEQTWGHTFLAGFQRVTLECQIMLQDLGLAPVAEDMPNTWRSTVHVLDIAILSYVGAHIQPLGGVNAQDSVVLPSADKGPLQDLAEASSHGSTFQDPSSKWGTGQQASFQRSTGTWGILPTRIIFRRRSFLCLHEFLGHQNAWVCENWNADDQLPRAESQEKLYLSADAETFADIWGPMWSSHIPSRPSEILQYNVGNGMILAWKHAEDSRSNEGLVKRTDPGLCDIKRKERLCHWISNTDCKIESNLNNSTGRTLSPDDILLIGAELKLQPNQFCKSSIVKVTGNLRDAGSLHPAGTIKRSRYKDSETYQAHVGWSGIGIGFQINYKIRERSLKDTIVEIWKNEPRRRKPRILESWLGVEVSMCTHNARRQRLITLLGTHTMLKYLKSLSLEWNNLECETQFYAALENTDHTAFRILWETNAEWRSDLGAAIGCCLDVLADTGTTENCLNAFWVPEAAHEYMVALRVREHSWGGFLTDSRDSCTMAVLNSTCLELSIDCVSSCPSGRHVTQSTGSSFISELQASPLGPTISSNGSILETSIIVNKDCIPRYMPCRKYRHRDGSAGTYEQRWNVSQLKFGDTFILGEKGNLKVIEPLSRGRILAVWKSPNLITGVKGGSAETHHEFMDDEELDTRPLDVILLSRNMQNSGSILGKPSNASSKTQEPSKTATSNTSELAMGTSSLPAKEASITGREPMSASTSASIFVKAPREEHVSSGPGWHRHQ